ncbi:ImmA/IrrE family metallo-endopeptidase [Fuchsiella alkaliacetigena]|uniref:ImmA/IrrE family metallo-endopeptidase n=1 Tax=Fuchsiella alkaliacetigena TaxID=957042 RepID=UPI00200ABCE9|nr:ImmA/IrrE family metallo-endopeptidase [Fuchsiella alkaliacetigena]MCK8824690.1 ImmA/IrrE family metallo-endopeptidase [Fuchsiella alkaliacetigena]
MEDDIKQEIIDALQDTYISFEEWARSNNIYYHTTRLPSGFWGFVYKSAYSNYFIIIDKNLTKQMQQEVFMHEVEHILYHSPKKNYIIGLDMQHTSIENAADGFASEMIGIISGISG